MASAPARARVVREVSNQRIAQRIHDQSDHQCETDQIGAYTHHLAVKDQEEVIEAIAFNAKGHRPKAVGNFSTDTDRAVIAHCDSSAFVIFGAFDSRLPPQGTLKKV